MGTFVTQQATPTLFEAGDKAPAPGVLRKPGWTENNELKAVEANSLRDATLDLRTEARGAVFNVKHYGATGDGTTDDATAIQAALVAAMVHGFGTVYFPRGAYLVSGLQLFIDSSVRLVGEGADIILGRTGYILNATLAGGAGLASARPLLEVRGLTFRRATYGDNTSGGLYIDGGWSGVTIEGCTFYGVGAPGLDFRHNTNVVVRNCRFPECFSTDLIALGTTAGEPVYVLTLENNFFQYVTGEDYLNACVSGAVRHLRCIGNAFEKGARGLYLSGAVYSAEVANNFVEECRVGVEVGADVGGGYLTDALAVSIRHNHFVSSGANFALSTAVKVVGQARSLRVQDNVLEVGTGLNVASTYTRGLVYENNALVRCTTPLTGTPNITHPLQGSLDVLCVDACDKLDANHWVKNYSDFATTDSEGVGEHGRQAIQSVVTGGYADFRKSFSALDLSGYDYFVVAVFISDIAKMATTGPGLLFFDTDAANHYDFAATLAYSAQVPFAQTGWNYLLFKKTAATASGAPSWSTITRVRVSMNAASGQSVTARWGGVWAVKVADGELAASAENGRAQRALQVAVGPVRLVSGKAAPTTGTWRKGDVMLNEAATVGSPKGWRCTVAGTPGTWVSEGNL